MKGTKSYRRRYRELPDAARQRPGLTQLTPELPTEMICAVKAACDAGLKKTARDAGFFGSGQASDDRCDGAYIGYVTEQMEEAAAARSEKDKSE